MLDALVADEWQKRVDGDKDFDEARLRELIKENTGVLDKVTPYVTPRLKSMEVKGEVTLPTVKQIDMTGGLLTDDEVKTVTVITGHALENEDDD